jgi:hypothetical protein
LHHATGALRGIDEQASFADIVRAGFFYINMLSSLEPKECRGHVPVVRRSDKYGIHRFVLEYMSEVFHRSGRFAGTLFDFTCRDIAPLLIGIADIGDFHILVTAQGAQVIHPHTTRSD